MQRLRFLEPVQQQLRCGGIGTVLLEPGDNLTLTRDVVLTFRYVSLSLDQLV